MASCPPQVLLPYYIRDTPDDWFAPLLPENLLTLCPAKCRRSDDSVSRSRLNLGLSPDQAATTIQSMSRGRSARNNTKAKQAT